MKTRVLTIILLAAVFNISTQAGYGQSKLTGGLVEITNIPSSNVLFQNEGIIITLLQTTCSEQVSEMVFGAPYGTEGCNFIIKCKLEARSKVADQDLFNYLFYLEIGSEGEKGVELRGATMVWLREFIAIRHADTRVEIEDRWSLAKHNLEEFEKGLAKLQEKQQALIAAGGQGILSRSRVQDELRSLSREKQSIELELRGMAARSGALQEQIAKVAEQVEKNVGEDPIRQELERILEIKQMALSRAMLLVQNNQVTPGELNKYQEEVARARIEVAQRREQIGNKALGGEMLGPWNKELADMSIRRAETEVHHRYFSDQLAEIEGKNLLELAGQFEQLEREIDQTQSLIFEAKREAEKIRREMQMVREPKVALLGDN